MTDRLSALDASFLYVEDRDTPMHAGSVMIFDPPKRGFDLDRLASYVAARIESVPRYRQKVVTVPGRIAKPVWVDDTAFDVSYHVRRSGLPRPGTDEQLEEFVARIESRPLDLKRPLWELYIVEGLEHGRFAVITKTHYALVDGLNAVSLDQLLVSRSRRAGPDDAPDPTPWRPRSEPSAIGLVTDAVLDVVRSPSDVVDTLRGGAADLRATYGRMLGALGAAAATLAKVSTRPAPSSPLNVRVSGARRFVMVGTDLEDYRTVRAGLMEGRFAEEVTINDVILATIAGALRSWLLTRGEAVLPTTTIRAMVPVSVMDADDPAAEVVGGLKACYVDLPVGEAGAGIRLQQVAFAMLQEMENGSPVGADALAGIGGFAPPTLHALGARLGSAVSRRLYNLVVTNVPGPQHPLYAMGARLLASYPVLPLSHGQALSIGLTSYDGGVYYGLLADRVTIPDADVLGQCIVDALAELIASQQGTRA
ncbi:conserved hypothetical protein [Nostocoides japonicum T1-X7]|uniref:Diacylglycerol O-acyltransferase n=1 Tax=Nostocoides japonicum T1-X7 TaxID=1194083 RepID=A0A077LUW5_9MICO|nr:wax ester/triacylglycerol synthase family O-acyltransferase [Tetrasphaera japonica]CCH76537.1 conserved hypothetical protein [Tetrasphaera japonica T1-X7]